MTGRALLLACAAPLLFEVLLAEARADNLFDPTPRDEMRELSTDRPDQTESPYTVDAGHLQLELDILSYARDHEDRVRRESLTAGGLNLKVGLLEAVDLQLLLPLYVLEQEHDERTHERSRVEGWGDVTIRLKWNLWGNDGGRTAFGLLPFVVLPAAKDGLGVEQVEGGLALPFSADLVYGFGLGAMAELDVVTDEEEGDGHYRLETFLTITLGHDLVGGLACYVEFTARLAAHRPWIGTVDVGLTWGVTDDIQLDCGANVGVTSAADDIEPFLGLTVRF